MAGIRGYSLKEVAAKVGVAKATIVRWIEKKKVDVRRKKDARGHYFFTEADLRKLSAYKNRIIRDDSN